MVREVRRTGLKLGAAFKRFGEPQPALREFVRFGREGVGVAQKRVVEPVELQARAFPARQCAVTCQKSVGAAERRQLLLEGGEVGQGVAAAGVAASWARVAAVVAETAATDAAAAAVNWRRSNE